MIQCSSKNRNRISCFDLTVAGSESTVAKSIDNGIILKLAPNHFTLSCIPYLLTDVAISCQRGY